MGTSGLTEHACEGAISGYSHQRSELRLKDGTDTQLFELIDLTSGDFAHLSLRQDADGKPTPHSKKIVYRHRVAQLLPRVVRMAL
jgi:hypothetical protein